MRVPLHSQTLIGNPISAVCSRRAHLDLLGSLNHLLALSMTVSSVGIGGPSNVDGMWAGKQLDDISNGFGMLKEFRAYMISTTSNRRSHSGI